MECFTNEKPSSKRRNRFIKLLNYIDLDMDEFGGQESLDGLLETVENGKNNLLNWFTCNISGDNFLTLEELQGYNILRKSGELLTGEKLDIDLKTSSNPSYEDLKNLRNQPLELEQLKNNINSLEIYKNNLTECETDLIHQLNDAQRTLQNLKQENIKIGKKIQEAMKQNLSQTYAITNSMLDVCQELQKTPHSLLNFEQCSLNNVRMEEQINIYKSLKLKPLQGLATDVNEDQQLYGELLKDLEYKHANSIVELAIAEGKSYERSEERVDNIKTSLNKDANTVDQNIHFLENTKLPLLAKQVASCHNALLLNNLKTQCLDAANFVTQNLEEILLHSTYDWKVKQSLQYLAAKYKSNIANDLRNHHNKKQGLTQELLAIDESYKNSLEAQERLKVATDQETSKYVDSLKAKLTKGATISDVSNDSLVQSANDLNHNIKYVSTYLFSTVPVQFEADCYRKLELAKLLESHLWNGPTRQIQMKPLNYTIALAHCDQQMLLVNNSLKQLAKKFVKYRTDIAKDGIKRAKKLLWVWFLTNPTKLLQIIQEPDLLKNLITSELNMTSTSMVNSFIR